MVRLEDLTAGSSVCGIDSHEAVTIVAVQWHGSDAVSVTFRKAGGETESALLYRSHEADLEKESRTMPWSFMGDGNLLKLVLEAWRIHYAHLFDPYLAVHLSDVEPLPHQISAVYKEMLPRLPLRYILADDPGAGKTIMTGLLIRELITRGDLRRCLIVSPGSLAEQWQEELFRKFHLRFKVLTNELLNASASGSVFEEESLLIARLDKLARSRELQEQLSVTDWDLVVCDEAHKMSAGVWGGEVKKTKRFQLGELLGGITGNLLLLTATPHNGKEEDFQLFLSLVDSDRFGGVARTGAGGIDVSDVMRRLVKEDLLKFDATPLFPGRRACTVNYQMSDSEQALYEAVTDYVRDGFNRADRLHDNKRRATVGFTLMVLQRRLASSPEAIYQSLSRRRARLEERLEETRRCMRESARWTCRVVAEDDDEDDYSASELETMEEELVDAASASETVSEMEAEIATLRLLEARADEVRRSGTDRKWEELSRLLQDPDCMYDAHGVREKLIIFTEHRDTLTYLVAKIGSLLGDADHVLRIDGSMGRAERHAAEERFRQDREAFILVATDAAGEGLNLQRAHLMINYDLPWNPNRVEQRFGRIHRIGQQHVCMLWNLVADGTQEGRVFQRLFEKLEQERASLGGKVFDILGRVTFDNRPLRDLLRDAVRDSGQSVAAVRAVDRALDTKQLRQLMHEQVLTSDVMDAEMVCDIREDMERQEARRLQPFYIEAFFKEAFASLGGIMSRREKGRWEVRHVPAVLREGGAGRGQAPVLRRYGSAHKSAYITAVTRWIFVEQW